MKSMTFSQDLICSECGEKVLMLHHEVLGKKGICKTCRPLILRAFFKPCPFCGSTDHIDDWHTDTDEDGDSHYMFGCERCDIGFPYYLKRDLKGLHDKWNTRVNNTTV